MWAMGTRNHALTGGGAKVWPARPGRPAPAAGPGHAGSASPGRAAAGAPPTRVLIVDDGACARKGLRALLDTYPDIAVVGAVGDGAEAVDWLRVAAPEVVLLDSRLPLQDSLALTRRLKAAANGPLRVIVLSYCAAYREAALAAGADVFLVKGGPVEALVSAIRGREDPGPA